MFHGSALLTRDLDVCVVPSVDNVARLRDTFRALHPTYRQSAQRLSFLDHPDPCTALDSLYLQT
jgi:hypothetical protein